MNRRVYFIFDKFEVFKLISDQMVRFVEKIYFRMGTVEKFPGIVSDS